MSGETSLLIRRPPSIPALRRLAAERPLALRVEGSCMAPALGDGEVVTVAPARWYLPGDVITYRQTATGRLLVHRVLGYRPCGAHWGLVVAGDHCSSHDGRVLPEQVIGAVCSVRSSGGRPLRVAASDRVRALRRWLELASSWLLRRLG